MAHRDGGVLERAIAQVGELMCVAATTAPKGRGRDNLVTAVVTGEEKARLAAEIKKISGETGFFVHDGGCVENSPAVVVIGAKSNPLDLPACGFCGFGDCQGCRNAGAICAHSLTNLGIAAGSAAGVAAAHHVDCRVMFSVGTAAIKLGILGPEIRTAYGMPLSATAKNPFFDRR